MNRGSVFTRGDNSLVFMNDILPGCSLDESIVIDMRWCLTTTMLLGMIMWLSYTNVEYVPSLLYKLVFTC